EVAGSSPVGVATTKLAPSPTRVTAPVSCVWGLSGRRDVLLYGLAAEPAEAGTRGHPPVGVDAVEVANPGVVTDGAAHAEPGPAAQLGSPAESGVGADDRVRTDDCLCVNPGAGADPRATGHPGAGVDVGRGVDERAGVDHGSLGDEPAAERVRVVPQRLARHLFDLDVLLAPAHASLIPPSGRGVWGRARSVLGALVQTSLSAAVFPQSSCAVLRIP